MCRMALVVGNVSLKRALEGVKRMAAGLGGSHEMDNEIRTHPHGWGMAWHTGELWNLHKSVNPMFADLEIEECFGIQTHVALIHARHMTKGGHTKENVHPFVLGDYAFCHNGSVHDPLPAGDVSGETDSERLFHALIEAEDRFKLLRDLKDYTGVNCFLATGDDVLVSSLYSGWPIYYTLHRLDLEEGFVIASEPIAELGDEWRPFVGIERIDISQFRR